MRRLSYLLIVFFPLILYSTCTVGDIEATRKRSKLQWNIDSAFAEVQLYSLQEKYEGGITLPLMKLYQKFDDLISPNAKIRAAALEPFFTTCENSNSEPMSLMNYLYHTIVSKCPLPTKDTVKSQNALAEALFSVERANLGDLGDREMFLIQKNKLLRTDIGADTQKTIIHKLSRANITFQYAALVLAQETNSALAGLRCILETVGKAHQYKREVLRLLAMELTTDVIRTRFIGVMCSYITNDDTDARVYYSKLIWDKAHSIFTHLADWIQETETCMWPELFITPARQAVVNSKMVTTDGNYERTATAVRKSFSERGSERYTYQILVLGVGHGDNFGLLHKNKHSVDFCEFSEGSFTIHVFRVEVESQEHQKRALDGGIWFKNNEEEMKLQLTNRASSLPKKVIEVFKEKFAAIRDRDNYRFMAFVKETIWGSINYAVASSSENITDSTQHFSIEAGSWLFPLNWEVFFFI